MMDTGWLETYLIPGETLIQGGRGRREGGEAFHPGIGYASNLDTGWFN